MYVSSDDHRQGILREAIRRRPGPRVAVLASGRGSNFVALTRAFRGGEVPGTLVALISDRQDAGALDEARSLDVPAFHIPWKGRERFEDYLLTLLRGLRVEFIFLAGFMRLLSPKVVDAYSGRILNVHPSLLPRYPGLNAQRRALDAGERETGCTVHVVDHGMDTGPILVQRRVPILPGDTVESLTERIKRAEHRCYVDAAKAVLGGEMRLDVVPTVRTEGEAPPCTAAALA